MRHWERFKLSDLELLIRQNLGTVTLCYKENECAGTNPIITFVSSQQRSTENIKWKIHGLIIASDRQILCKISLVYNIHREQSESEYPILVLEQKNGRWEIAEIDT